MIEQPISYDLDVYKVHSCPHKMFFKFKSTVMAFNIIKPKSALSNRQGCQVGVVSTISVTGKGTDTHPQSPIGRRPMNSKHICRNSLAHMVSAMCPGSISTIFIGMWGYQKLSWIPVFAPDSLLGKRAEADFIICCIHKAKHTRQTKV